VKRRLVVLGILTLIIGALGSVWLAHAQVTITVNSFVDAVGTCPATCTLRAAILAANPGDTIEFSGSGTISVNAAGGLGELPSLSAGGVTIDAGANQVVLDGSLSPGGDPPLAYGLRINSDDNIIFGLVIEGFAGDGILIEGGSGNQIGGTGADEGNLIHLNGGSGIVLDAAGSQASPNVIQGNLIGTDAIGTSVEANGGVGIVLRNGSEFNVIGGTTSTAANIISGNNGGGVLIDDSSDNTIEGNRIGLDGGTGVTGLGNGGAGVRIENGGGNNQITNNAISASAGDGVIITGSDDNAVTDNRIGLDAFFGIVGIGNGGYGIRLLNADGTIITGNSIADNDEGGVLISNGSSNTTVGSNRIGLGANGTTAIGNGGDGVQIASSNNNTVNDNSIGSNSGDGVEINGSSGNTISSNRIGLNQSLGTSGNGGNGVLVTGNGANNLINGNTISNNTGAGVFVASGSGNTISGNTMANNGGLGIDLAPAGVTPNDAGDGDTGANGLQNFPVIQSALFDGVATTRITGTLNSTPGLAYTLEFFANAVCDPTGYGEAQTVLGATVNVTTGAGGNGTFVVDVVGLTAGDFVTATATRPDSSTSEFALCEAVVLGLPTANFSAAPTSGNAPLSVSFTDLSTGFITDYLWDFGNGDTSTLQNPVYVFTTPGTYVVELTVTGPGGTDTATRTIVVTSAPGATQPPPTSPPQVVPSASPSSTLVPSATSSLTATASATVTTTPTPSATFTPISTATSTSSSTPTLTATPTNTATATLTRTPTATSTSTSTRTPTFTATFTVTASVTPTFTLTPLPTFTPTATPTPDLGVTKVADDDGFLVIVENAGQSAANNIGLIEALRPGVRYIASRPGAPVCIEDAGVVFCALGRIASGDSAVVDFDVITDGTDPTSGRTIITSSGVQLVVIDEPYLLKIGEPPVAGPGAVVTYTLRVINPTNAAALQVRVEDRMPDTLIIESASASTGVVTTQGQNVTFSLDRLEAGGRATVTVITRVRQTDTGADEILNRACLTSQNNRVPSCAQMRFVRAGELPSTGEPPAARWLVMAVLLTLCAWAGRRFVLPILRR
jgi:CSLREA domain-containing protein